MPSVLVTDDVAEAGLEILRRESAIQLDVKKGIKAGELKSIIGNYDALIVRSETKVTAEIISAAAKLRVIGRAGIGLDNVDLDAATKRGIVCMNTPDGNVTTTAEHAIAMICALARRIPQAAASMKAGKWEKKKFMGKELFEKTLAVFGLGKIGSVVADRAQGLKMRVIAYDPYVSKEAAEKRGVELVTFDEALRRADFITIHMALTKETKGLLNAAAFENAKPGLMIVNCARGGMVDEKDLEAAIKSGKVGGAALDVFETEPPGNHPLLALDAVIATPHLGASTDEAQVNVAIAVAEQVRDFLLHGVVRNALNAPTLPAADAERLGPYVTLAERVGKMAAQLALGGFVEIEIAFHGEIAKGSTAPLRGAALKGVMSAVEQVNEVSAPMVAKDRGIRVTETRSEESADFASLITVTLRGPAGERRVAGTLFGKREPRIVLVDSIALEVVPEGTILVVENEDRPGVVGAFGTLLGKHKVNIARMQLGLDPKDGHALTLANIDAPVSDELLEEIEDLPNVLTARQITIS